MPSHVMSYKQIRAYIKNCQIKTDDQTACEFHDLNMDFSSCDNGFKQLCVTNSIQELVFKSNYRLMQAKSIAECSKGSILQYFRPSLSYQLLLISLFCLFWSVHFTQVLL